jgi:hypothetical protein
MLVEIQHRLSSRTPRARMLVQTLTQPYGRSRTARAGRASTLPRVSLAEPEVSLPASVLSPWHRGARANLEERLEGPHRRHRIRHEGRAAVETLLARGVDRSAIVVIDQHADAIEDATRSGLAGIHGEHLLRFDDPRVATLEEA